MGYFYWLRVRSSNHLHTELNLRYLKGTKFCLESKASFIDIKAVLDRLVAKILYFFGQSRGQLKVLALVKIHSVGKHFPKKIMFYYETFFPLQICSSFSIVSSSLRFYFCRVLCYAAF